MQAATANPRPTTAKGPPSSDRRPLFVLLSITGVLMARWIWIAGLGDYGWNYELGMRVGEGEVPYRDFICTLPQLTSYTIVPFLALFKGNLWAFAVHLYFWWIASLWVSWKISRNLGLRAMAQAGAIFFAACLSLPAIHLGHAYSYAGTFFFGLTLLQLRDQRRQANLKRLFLAGAFAGLGVFAKQNIGIMAGLLGMGVIAYDSVITNQVNLVLRRSLVFCAGAATAFLPIFCYFASQAGASEVFQQMFSDAGAGKGGLFGMLFHVLPLIFFTTETPFRQVWTFTISGGLVLLFLGLVGRKMYRLQKLAAAEIPNLPAPRDNWKLLLSAIVIVIFASMFSLFDLPLIRDWCNKLHPAAIYNFHGYVAPLVFIAYSFFTALAAICLLSVDLWRKPAFFLPIFALPLILWGHELSCEGYLPFGAPVVVPLAVLLLETTGLIRNTLPLTSVAGTVLILGLAASTQNEFQPSSFKSVERLPANTKFAGLYARPDFAANIREQNENVVPMIKDQSTLWLCIGGPHSAWGGKSVFSIATLFGDTYNLRSEPALFERWKAQPPQFIFVGDRNYCPGSRLFPTDALNLWLPQDYDPVWKSSRRAATLWQLRSGTNNPVHLKCLTLTINSFSSPAPPAGSDRGSSNRWCAACQSIRI